MFTQVPTAELDAHIATYATGRAVQYQIRVNGKRDVEATITIDLVSREDIGYRQASSNLLAALWRAGFKVDQLTSYEISKWVLSHR